MRIILAKTPALSFVSPVRILRVPRPGEIGLGLLNAKTERKAELRGGGHTSEGTFSLFGSSVAFQVLLPLICLLCLLLITTAGVCCWRNYGRRPLGSRQIHFSPVDASSSSSPTRVSLREIHAAQKLHRGTQGRKDKDKRTAEVAKGLVRFQNSFTDSHNLPEYSKENYAAGDEEETRCAQIKPLHASTSMLRTLKNRVLFYIQSV
ncbi:unnamed protein product [Dibothriocephalus latus]|uniref:Uncharacterized protein n=1 Tax=Dibothriocephalus latus TaxID=60516 RepID=A0A3P6SEJ0_DIBLA|nr:unnamed protein product [Dibothriocephalus latus]